MTGETLNLENPSTFNEKIQWLKLYDSTALKTKLADKYLVREWVAQQIGEEYLIPLLGVWDHFDEIDFDKLPQQFVLKANHGSGWNIIVKDKSKLDKTDAKEKFDLWMTQNYSFQAGLELHYMNIPPKIIAEEYIENMDDLYDYKFMCFDGKVAFLWVDTERYTNHRRTLYDLSWNQKKEFICYPPSEQTIKRPDNLDEMISLAEKLSQGFSHVRVDFYEIDGNVRFGELTFTSETGVALITPPEFHQELGSLITLPQKSPFPTKELSPHSS